MKLSTSEYFIKEVYTSFKRNIWMTLASIFTVVLSLFILGFFSIVILNLNKMADTLESQVQISVYLKDDLSQEEIDETKETLSKIEGLQDIKFTTREEAMENFKERLGDQQFLLDALDDLKIEKIIIDFAFEKLNLKRLLCINNINNHVIKIHKFFGFKELERKFINNQEYLVMCLEKEI